MCIHKAKFHVFLFILVAMVHLSDCIVNLFFKLLSFLLLTSCRSNCHFLLILSLNFIFRLLCLLVHRLSGWHFQFIHLLTAIVYIFFNLLSAYLFFYSFVFWRSDCYCLFIFLFFVFLTAIFFLFFNSVLQTFNFVYSL